MKRRLAIATTLFLLASSLFAQNDLQPLAVIKLNRSETITIRQLKTRVEFVQKQYGVTLTPEQRAEVLESLIDEKLIVQAAAKEGMTITDSQVDQTFLSTFSQQLGRQITEAELETIIRQQVGMSLNDYLLASTGMGTSDYKAYLKNQIIAQQYVYVKKQAEIAAVEATDAEIRAAFELNRSSYYWNDMAKLFLVIVPKGSSSASAQALATGLRDQYVAAPATAGNVIAGDANNGVQYQAGNILVQKTAAQATQLGWSYDNILELFGKETGYVSELSETATDFQFYAVQQKYDAKLLSLSDIAEPDTNVTVYEIIKANLTAQKQSQFFSTAAQQMADSLDTTANVERKKSGADLTALLNW